MVPNPSSPLDEIQWVIRIRRTLEEKFELDAGDQPVSVCDVPKPLLCCKPEAYVPQVVSLGPYHHHREDLHDMERHKLSAARRAQNQLPGNKFRQIVDAFVKLEYQIRACYHRYLKFNGETLAWMLAVDASFLLEFHQIFVCNKEDATSPTTRAASSCQGITLAHNLILRDVVMLENQILLFLLRRILELQVSSPQVAQEALSYMLIGFAWEVSPFKSPCNSACTDLKRHSHLHEFLYHLVAPTVEETLEVIMEGDDGTAAQRELAISVVTRCGRKLLELLWDRCRAFVVAILKFVAKVMWGVVSNMPGLSGVRRVAEQLLSQIAHSSKSAAAEALAGYKVPSSPLLEEIAIPSVAKLSSAGIRFAATNGDALSVEFDAKSATLHLPRITIDVNTEGVLRNLVAYEASIGSRALVLSRYVELMNGIIDAAEDAKLLRESGVVLNHLKTDEEVAELWNGMTRSIRLTRVPALDKVIEDVNRYYHGKWKVKLGKLTKRYASVIWNFLAFSAVVLILFVMVFQVFCMSYGCAPRFRSRMY